MRQDLTQKQYDAAMLLSEALNGEGRVRDNAVLKLQEGISTSDLPVQLSPALTRIYVDRYQEVPSTWTDYAERLVVDDFESNEYYEFEFDDSDIPGKKDGRSFYSTGLAPVGEFGEYPVIRFSASGIKLDTQKSGVRIGFSWEALRRRGNVQLLRRTMQEFGARAKRTENLEAAGQLVTKTGINARNIKNRVDGNPALSLAAVEKALAQIAASKNAKGRRIITPPTYNLVVPSTLAAKAESLKAVQEIERVVDGDTLRLSNPIAGKIAKVVEVPELTTIAEDNANDVWFLVPTIGSGTTQNIVNVFLSGHESPRVFVRKDTNSSPEDGSFENDSYETKVRHFVKGGFISDVGMIASDGSGK